MGDGPSQVYIYRVILTCTIYSHLGDSMKFEAWILRDLTYMFSRAVKRGHRPREDQFIILMNAADLPIPPPSSRSSSSLGYFEKLAYGLCF